MQEYSSGAYKVPSVGAGTANTEFESITGMNLRYFGPGEYRYKTILKKTTCGRRTTFPVSASCISFPLTTTTG